jgi:anti-sigma factor RsiW
MHVSDDDLHAFVDRALPPGRMAEIEAWLEANPEQSLKVRQYREQIEGFHRLYDPVLEEPVPEALLRAAAWRRSSLAPIFMRVAAAVLLFASGAGGGWWLHGALPPPPFQAELAREAIAAHTIFAAEVRHPVEVAASDQAHLVGWLSKRLGKQLRTPDLSAEGFSLVGGRLLPAAEGAAAQFMYENAVGKRLTVYVARSARSETTAFRFAAQGGTSAFYWIDGDFAYVIAGGIERETLSPIARDVYRQLEGDT